MHTPAGFFCSVNRSLKMYRLSRRTLCECVEPGSEWVIICAGASDCHSCRLVSSAFNSPALRSPRWKGLLSFCAHAVFLSFPASLPIVPFPPEQLLLFKDGGEQLVFYASPQVLLASPLSLDGDGMSDLGLISVQHSGFL